MQDKPKPWKLLDQMESTSLDLASKLVELVQRITEILLNKEELEPFSLATLISTLKTGKLRTLPNKPSEMLSVCQSQKHQKEETEALASSNSKIQKPLRMPFQNLESSSMEETYTSSQMKRKPIVKEEETSMMMTDLKDSELVKCQPC